MSTLDVAIVVLYFAFTLGFGSIFGRLVKTTKDFFFGGQRFAWWLIAVSCSSMVVGSYSFVKYSQVAYQYGIASTQSYLNDWILLPLWLFGWFPIIYYSRIQSVPEYMGKRFGPRARLAMTVLLLVYMVGYIGINFYTMGVALNALMPWSVVKWAMVTALVTAIYVSFGGQPSVIMTDLAQGLMLMAAGILIFVLGVGALGGLDRFWSLLPAAHRTAFSGFNAPSKFPAVGIFWQDGMANTAAFYFLNQGLVMRFLSVRSERDGRKAMFTVVALFMPLTAFAVSSAGWIGSALENAGLLGQFESRDVFVRVTQFLCAPGVFGFVMAALIAALMSTVDALINAVSAVFVNDVWNLYVRPVAASSDKQNLRVARIASFLGAMTGLLLVPVYLGFGSIYSAHAAFTASITPPLVCVVVLAFLWKRFSEPAALATMLGGIAAVLLSFVVPDVVSPFSHGVEPGGSHAHAYTFMRALYALVVSAAAGGIVALSKPNRKDVGGLCMTSLYDLVRRFKQGEPKLRPGRPAFATLQESEPGTVTVASDLAEAVGVEKGDYIYVTAPQWWYGGLFSTHAVVQEIDEEARGRLVLGRDLVEHSRLRPGTRVKVWRVI